MTTAISLANGLSEAQVGSNPRSHLPFAFGGSWYFPYANGGDVDRSLLAAMKAAYDLGIRHFDTASGYGNGHSEELYGKFLKGRRDDIFIASKANPEETSAAAIYDEVCASLRRLGVERIDLYYIHWPRTGRDMRPIMQGLERARAEGKIGAIGVSNFSVAEMESLSEVGRIDAHQLGHNLLWRRAEADIIPYCAAHDIAVYAYSTLSHGILTGKFARDLGLVSNDQRNGILPFKSENWPHVFEAVEEMKSIAAEAGRPLAHLAIRWNLSRPGITGVVVGSRSAEQAAATIPALVGDIPDNAFERLTAISDRVILRISEANNLFGVA